MYNVLTGTLFRITHVLVKLDNSVSNKVFPDLVSKDYKLYTATSVLRLVSILAFDAHL